MTLENLDSVKELALKYALYNAVKHEGKALLEPVISKIVAERPDLKPKIKEIEKYFEIEQIHPARVHKSLTRFFYVLKKF